MRYDVLKFKEGKSRNPYFIGILSAIKQRESYTIERLQSQSLFYWNPFCNTECMLNIIEEEVSQSLFYWNPFCNTMYHKTINKIVI